MGDEGDVDMIVMGIWKKKIAGHREAGEGVQDATQLSGLDAWVDAGGLHWEEQLGGNEAWWWAQEWERKAMSAIWT